MTRLISAELLKLRSTRTFLGCVLAALALVPISVALAILEAGPHGAYMLNSSAGVRHVLAAAGSAASVVVVVGILTMAGEFRHSTATATFLITPQRGRVVAAKARRRHSRRPRHRRRLRRTDPGHGPAVAGGETRPRVPLQLRRRRRAARRHRRHRALRADRRRGRRPGPQPDGGRGRRLDLVDGHRRTARQPVPRGGSLAARRRL